jgi:formamidopyrimidine-DNA glycosylase
MPELPEVQTTVSGLQKHIVGRTISSIYSEYKRKIDVKNALGQKVISVKRRAKNILIDLENEYTLLIHMKMTGHLLFDDYDKTDPFNRHIRFKITFKDGTELHMSDMRRFAKVEVIKDPDLSHLGPEPLEKAFTFLVFKKCLFKKPNGRIKPTLLDQTVLSGVGNIYSDESLWRAGINPEQMVKSISDAKLKLLYEAICTTLKKGIDFGGDSMSDYRNIHGKPGKFQEKHQAYRRTGKPCMKKGCKGIILRKMVAGRSSHFCSVHQKLVK